MLRPERMSKVSVTGSKRVIDDVIETAYEHHSLHVTDYDGTHEGFKPGDSLEGAEEVNDRLVTVRSLESILEVDDEDAGPTGVLDDEELEAELVDVRERVNELTDRRDELRDRVRDHQEEIDRMEPFAELGIDLDLLRGYDTLEVVVGEAKADPVEDVLAAADGIRAFEVFSGNGVVAAFAYPAEGADEGVLQDALVGVDIALLEVPEAETSPTEYVDDLAAEKREIAADLEDVETELDSVREEAASFLLRAEEQLTIEAEQKQAPLSFATTENAFIAEGWIPTSTVEEFADAIDDAVGDHADVEEIERAEFTPDGDHHTEAVDAEGHEAATDGGHETSEDTPPVVQNNGDIAGPFELLVKSFGRPQYAEFDPTLLVFLTFPLMFGFMIGDLGYGVLYAGIGVFLYKSFEGTIREMGAIAIWAGLFTMLFGVYYGFDIFGYHAYPHFGFEHWAISKGLGPGATEWALSWLVLSVLFGILHLNVGFVLSFLNNYRLHDLEHALYEGGSWLLLLNGAWLWIFSQHVAGPKPAFLFDSIAVLTLGTVEFSGFPVVVGYLGLALAGVGALLLAIGEPAELVEVLSPIVNVVSYARIMAVLLAKGGMALAVNLLAFGAYIGESGEGSFHFIFTPSHLEYVQNHPDSYELVFAGLTTSAEMPIVGLVVGVLVAIVGHIVVLLLGITSAGIQGVRLEYVEFFGKFYEGGGEAYSPFGYDREYTANE
ncbi:V/A-type H+-transporting ATPase subunit I [Halopenitus malekzadehii]|uniref:A-type ATP synthase subunit I n=2 Tax=Halopenitus malekzadehii TaxID=1267564 RepID=A0A1H6HPF1_9EURY|nr:V/A-type H+-transporting ATPase subunit I [Halopenitus malekzadehii]